MKWTTKAEVELELRLRELKDRTEKHFTQEELEELIKTEEQYNKIKKIAELNVKIWESIISKLTK